MPTKYFAGNSLAGFARTNPAIVETTSAGKFESGIVASSIVMPSDNANYILSSTFSAVGTVWLRFDIYGPGALAGVGGVGPSLYNGSTGVFRVKATNIASGATTLQAQYWNGLAWTDTGSTFNITTAARSTLAIRVDLNSGFEAFLAGTSVASGTGWSGGQTTVTNFRGYNLSHQSPSYYSQVMIADYDIRDAKFMPAALTGNSAANTGAATGAYSDINETVLDDGTSVTVTSAGNKAGQVFADIALPVGYIIGAMVLNGRGRVNGSITDAKLGVRGSAGTNSSGSGLGYNAGYEPRTRIVTADPDTATNFTQSGFNASEIYEEAV